MQHVARPVEGVRALGSRRKTAVLEVIRGLRIGLHSSDCRVQSISR
jgi:hypothetical protein